MYAYCFPFFISITSLLIARWLIKTFTKSYNFPPSPPALPIIGHSYLLSSKLPESLQTLARRYGPLMQIRIGPSTYVVVSNTTVAKEIFTTHDLDFASRYEPCPSQYNIYDGSGFVTGPYGAYWRFMKHLCVTKLFAGPYQIDRFNKIRKQEIERLLKSLIMKNYSEEGGPPCNLGTEVTSMTNNLIFRMIMNKKRISENETENEAKMMRKLVVEMMGLAAKLGVSKVFSFRTKMDLHGHGKKLREVFWRYDELLEKIIRDYEDDNGIKNQENDDGDLMGILLETCRYENSEVKLTRNRIKYFVLELFLASVDGISASIQWAIAELMKRPQMFKKLRDEIDSVVGLTRLVNESDVSELPFLQAVLKETLRLHPLGSIIHRECIRDCKINGFDVKVKTRALINAYAIMRDPDAWNDPDEFLPERFLNSDAGHHDEMEMKGQDFCYIPFGGGSRGCVGSTYANLVMHTTIGALVQCFDWKINLRKEVDQNLGSGFSGEIALPLVCYPIARFDPFS